MYGAGIGDRHKISLQAWGKQYKSGAAYHGKAKHTIVTSIATILPAAFIVFTSASSPYGITRPGTTLVVRE